MLLFLKNTLNILVITLTTVLLLECTLRIYNPVQLPIKGRQFILDKSVEYTLVAKEKYPGLDQEVTVRTNSIGLRGPEPPLLWDSYYKIITVGGSTTHCISNPDGKTWPDEMHKFILSEHPDIWVNNAGKDGTTTYGHLVLLNQILKDLKPDMILYLVGLNDFALQEYGSDVNGLMTGMNPSDKFYVGRKSPFKKIESQLLDFSELYNLVNVFYMHYKAANRGLVLNSDEPLGGYIDWDGIARDPEKRKPKIVISDAVKEKLIAKNKVYQDKYEKRLTYLVRETIKSGIEPVLITQSFLGGCGKEESSDIDFSDYKFYIKFDNKILNRCVGEELMEMFNDTTRKVAKSENLFLIDLKKELPYNTKYYFDHIHYNNFGTKKVGQIISEKLSSYLKQKK